MLNTASIHRHDNEWTNFCVIFTNLAIFWWVLNGLRIYYDEMTRCHVLRQRAKLLRLIGNQFKAVFEFLRILNLFQKELVTFLYLGNQRHLSVLLDILNLEKQTIFTAFDISFNSELIIQVITLNLIKKNLHIANLFFDLGHV